MIGDRIRGARVARGLTQHELAQKTGMCSMYISEIERGNKMPSLKSFIKIVEALGISADYVLRNELSSGGIYIYDELTKKLRGLTPQQRKTAADILNAYIQNL